MIRKTAAITAASIAGVVLAGSAAVGANIGILNAADDSGLGTLSAESAVAATARPSTVVSADSGDDSNVQTFAVDVAGSVDIEPDDAGLHVKSVHANDGWEWDETTGGPGAVAVIFTSDDDVLEFHASLNDDDTIAARVDRPAGSRTPASSTAGPGPASADSHDDDHDEYDHDDGRDDDDHDDSGHEEPEHEGHDDDD